MKLLRRRLLAIAAPLLLAACATIGPPQPPSLELPKPPADLHAARKGDRVTLTWTVPASTTDRQTVRSLGSTQICRGLAAQLTQCGTPVGKAAPPKPLTAPKSPKQKITSSYIDTLPAQSESDDPSASITYAVEVLNAEGRGAGLSNQVQVSLIRALPSPRDFGARVTSGGIVLTWANDLHSAAPPLRYVYRIYRRLDESRQETLAAELPAGSEHALSFTDSNFEWEKTYEYRAEAVTVIAEQDKPEVVVEGDDSPEVKVFAHDVFPPTVPSGLQAVFSGPGQKVFIDLIWAPVTDVDLDGYNVYRHEEGSAPVKINTELVKTPAYRDTSVISGKHYLYSVSAVDLRGNESAHSEEAGETVP